MFRGDEWGLRNRWQGWVQVRARHAGRVPSFGPVGYIALQPRRLGGSRGAGPDRGKDASQGCAQGFKDARPFLRVPSLQAPPPYYLPSSLPRPCCRRPFCRTRHLPPWQHPTPLSPALYPTPPCPRMHPPHPPTHLLVRVVHEDLARRGGARERWVLAIVLADGGLPPLDLLCGWGGLGRWAVCMGWRQW